MSPFFIIVALGGVLGVVGLVVAGLAKPATAPTRNHRVDPPDLLDGGEFEPGTDPRTPAWRRALSLVELAIVTLAVGAVLAAVLAALTVFVASFLGSAF